MPNAPEQIHDHRFLLVAPSGISALLGGRGAGLVALKVPDRAGNFADIVLGFDSAQQYADHSQPPGSTGLLHELLQHTVLP